MRRALASLSLTIAAAVMVTGCGGSGGHAGSGRSRMRTQPASLVLDFTPNAIHVGIYDALAHHFDTRNGLALHVEVPGASTDAISELEAGRVDFAILDIHDLAIADEKDPTHPPIVGLMPIVQEPLAAVIAAPSVSSPRQLIGRTVGVTGDPSDLAVLDSIVKGSGGNPAAVKKLNIGYNAVADLLAGRVSAATAFWNDEGVTVNRRKPGYHVFRVTGYGAPSYPELIVCATSASLRRDPRRARELIRTLTEGYDQAIRSPTVGAHELEAQVQGLDPGLVAAELPGEIKAFVGPEHHFGTFDMALLARWARWEARFGIVKRAPDVRAMFDTALTAGR